MLTFEKTGNSQVSEEQTLVSRQNTRKEKKSVKHKVKTNNILEEKYGKHSSTTCYTAIQQTI